MILGMESLYLGTLSLRISFKHELPDLYSETYQPRRRQAADESEAHPQQHLCLLWGPEELSSFRFHIPTIAAASDISNIP